MGISQQLKQNKSQTCLWTQKDLSITCLFFTFRLFQFDIFEQKHMNKRAKSRFLNTNWKETSV